MKLLNARFENFRLLRDLEIEFSSDSERKLTVIRAANDTGKTTLLHALQWALYGDEALPGVDDFRLHPIDWDAARNKRVPITATVEFEVVKWNNIGGRLRPSTRKYRIVRSTQEELDGTNWRRSSSNVRLYLLGEAGASPIDNPESLIYEELPTELRDVFFTDGDRALSFIEAVTVKTKRERVQNAIRSLLGLGVLEGASKHVSRTFADINKQASKIGDGDLEKISADLNILGDEAQVFERDIEDAKQQVLNFDAKLKEVSRKIEETLVKGDREKLSKERDAAYRAVKGLEDQLTAVSKEHSALFKSEALARDILLPLFDKALGKLSELHDKGKIPKPTIPILEERLALDLCICGESLAEDGADGSRRRKHVCDLVEQSKRADALQDTISDLYFGSRYLEALGDESRWIEQYKKVVEKRHGLEELRDQEGKRLRGIEIQIDALQDTDIQTLREFERNYSDQRDRLNSKRSRLETQLEANQKQRSSLSEQRDRLLREKKRGAKILAEIDVVKDILQVLQSSYGRITNEELNKVSALMNEIFIDMIGVDPQQKAIIQRAEISKDFDIIVFGPDQRTLNPDRDLNGASRRALTLAFILALTKVSEVEAPNVIDTPLGMMSGYVKRSVLRRAVEESTQLVLFLTHSEIAGCEEIIDQYAGVIFTLTNTAHYPKQLVNDPGVAEHRSIKCDCNHKQSCQVCERRLDAEVLEDQRVA